MNKIANEHLELTFVCPLYMIHQGVVYLGKYVCDHSKNLNVDVSDVLVQFSDFYHNYANAFRMDAAAPGILNYTELNTSNKFVVFIPGFRSELSGKSEYQIWNSLRYLPDTYFIMLRNFLSDNPELNYLRNYQQSVTRAYYVGKALANMLVDLTNSGVSRKNIHLIGHSLGAHIVGYAGEIFYAMTNTRISRITGIDPAGPCYENIQQQIRSGEADFVDIYHCNAGEYGTVQNLGDANVLLNINGERQPDCEDTSAPGVLLSGEAAACSHMACQNFYFATVAHANLWAFKCPSYELFKNGRCFSDDNVIAGHWTPSNTTGIYYVSTAGFSIN